MKNTQIVVAYDFSESADLALERGIDIACRDPEHAYLHVVTAIDRHKSYRSADAIHDDLMQRLRSIFEARRPGVDIQLFVHVRIGAPVAEILGVAEDVGADLVLVGSHGRGAVGRFLLGSVSQGVLHGARCPVLVARKKDYADIELDKVVEVAARAPHDAPHRYHYSSSAALTRSPLWPIP